MKGLVRTVGLGVNKASRTCREITIYRSPAIYETAHMQKLEEVGREGAFRLSIYMKEKKGASRF